MRLFLQIDVSDWKERSYQNPLVRYASSLASDLVGTDIDSQSESAVIDLVVKLAEQAETILIYISASPDVPIGSVNKLIKYLEAKKERIHAILFHGENVLLENSIQPLADKLIRENDVEKIKEKILAFANS